MKPIEAQAAHDTAYADSGQIEQVLLNLANNAAHAMENGGTMTISLEEATFRPADLLPDPDLQYGPYLALSVKDTGTGMDEETRRHAFEPFYTTKEPGKGTGLGLPVVYGIAKAHEGAVTVKSMRGAGSTFTVFLPFSEHGAASAEADQEELRGKGRILFVDDEDLVAQSARDALSRLGYEVTTETEPRKALDRFAGDDRFDLVITDQAMPGMSGMSLSKALLDHHPGIPIILCTGYSAGVDEQTAKAAGIREFLMKPYTRAELSNIVRKVLPGAERG